ncbi:HNH endonuclease [Candidatus Woesearchaeota archaeon]|nr:MAG: hypothetical protein QT09_C0003G0032 [archaeon GW2011_AR18]MBS3162157.1 HNH endonuclease [Candidatus Woesearchaeota archaeon]HIH26249.1 HNH endonuclease [Nanoarchaeota archaeon]
MDNFNLFGVLPKKKPIKRQNVIDISKNLNMNNSFNSGFNPYNSNKKVDRDSRRTFSVTQRKELKSTQNNKCKICGIELSDDNIDYDHIIPWEDGGKTIVANGQAICLKCHREKTRKEKLKKVDKKRVNKTTNLWGF